MDFKDKQIYGNTAGIKKVTLDALKTLLGQYDKSLFIDRGVLSYIAELTSKINREISVFISRQGVLLAIVIGDSTSVPVKEIDLKRGIDRFSGVRCIHTHPDGSGELSDLDLSALKNLRMDCMAAVGVKAGKIADIFVGYLDNGTVAKYRFEGADDLDDALLLEKITEYENALDTKVKKVKAGNVAVLAGVFETEGSLVELKSLAETAGLKSAGEVVQYRAVPDKKYCLGSGKLEDLRHLIQMREADYVVFDNQLSGTQLTALEDALGVAVLDRTMLILEIFARHAESREGKLQVELARLKYTLPKLVGRNRALSRIGGGGGSGAYTKGAGETKLETDRRHIKRAIFDLNQKINKLKEERDLRRGRRDKTGVKAVSIVGYTNAGKSSIMNALTRAGVKAEDKLFATLDPVTRRVYAGEGREYLLTDTVGFIDRLPHELVDAFRSTLDETRYADLLIHIVDVSNPAYLEQFDLVGSVLFDIGASAKPVVTVYNKIDLNRDFLLPQTSDSVAVSAVSGENIEELKRLIIKKLFEQNLP